MYFSENHLSRKSKLTGDIFAFPCNMLARHHQDDMKLTRFAKMQHPGLLHPTPRKLHPGTWKMDHFWQRSFLFNVLSFSSFQGCRSKWYPFCIFVSQAILACLGELGSRLGRNSFSKGWRHVKNPCCHSCLCFMKCMKRIGYVMVFHVFDVYMQKI